MEEEKPQRREDMAGQEPPSMFWTQELTNRLVEIVKTGIILTNTHGKILFSNRLALDLLGYPDDALVGASVEDLFLPEDKKTLLPNIMKLNATGDGFEGEALLRKKDGSVFFVNLSTARYKSDVSDWELIVFTLQDITRLKKMERDCIDAERFAGLGKMTDEISHQIRNPIVSIGGFALRLAKEQLSGDEYAKYSQIIHVEAKRLERIIDKLAEFTHVHIIRYAPLTLSEVFHEAARASAVCVERGFDLVFPDPASLTKTPFFGDLSLLVRALESVIANGLEAIGEAGRVTIKGEIANNQVLVTVADNGAGIAVEDLPFIFDPFFTTKANCIGLGLTMARRIILEHKGRIDVKSAAGAGTSVLIALPAERRRAIRTRLI